MFGAIQGKIIVIVDANSDLGEAVARRLAQYRATLILGGSNPEHTQVLATELMVAGCDAIAIPTDARNPLHVFNLIEAAVAVYGRLDVMVNCLNLSRAATTRRGDMGAFIPMVDVNINGLLHGIYAALPQMIRQGYGHFINLGAPPATSVGDAENAGYWASRVAAAALSEGLREAASPYNVQVTTLPSHMGSARFCEMAALAITRWHYSRPTPPSTTQPPNAPWPPAAA